MTLALRLAAVVIAMSVFLGAMIARHAHIQQTGTEIILAMEPVDPRDMLLGYYVRIRTPVHVLDSDELEGEQPDWSAGDTIYLVLERDGDVWRPDRTARSRPDSGVFLQGRVARATLISDMREVEPQDGDPAWRTRREPIPGARRQQLNVRYNLERYYADPQTARELDTMRRDNRLRLIVAVSDTGVAVIKGLEIDGQAHYESLF